MIGKEYKKIKDALDKLDNLEVDHPWFELSSAQISLGHAKGKVRVNGHERLISILDCIVNLNDLKMNLKKGKKNIEKSLKITEQIIKIFYKQYEKCPKCKGTHGKKVQYGERDDLPKRWWDCENCNGLGYINKEKK